MPKFVAYEVFSIVAKTQEDAENAIKKAHAKSVVVVAPSLETLPHPVHLAEVQKMVK